MFIARFYEDELQPLSEHLTHVGEYSREFAKDLGLGNTAFIIGVLHDMGKYSSAFQEYIFKAKNNEFFNEEKVDHGVYGGKYIYEKYINKKEYGWIARDVISQVITYHHGGLPDNINENNKNPMLERFRKISDEEMREVENQYFKEMKNLDFDLLFEKSTEEIKNVCAKFSDRKYDIGMLVKTLYSCLVDADRLDSFLFTVSEKPEIEFDSKTIFKEYSEKLENKLIEFNKNKNINEGTANLNKYRNIISQKCKDFAANETGIYTLTVPTGGGKTLASLRFALNHNKKRIFYIMPYTTIVEQNAGAVRDILSCSDNLLEFHSNLAEENKSDEFELISERFDYPIVFTTMVQFLNAFFTKGNGNIRRLHNFSNSVIVFDEIQTLPLKCMSLFYKTLLYLKNVMNTTSILCTATQPDFDFIEENVGVKIDGEIIDNVDEIYENLKRMDVIDKTRERMTCETLAEFATELKEDVSSLLIVMNTVASAEKVYTNIKENCETECILLTSRLCPAHRKEIISDIKSKLKNGEEIICVSTQLIEAGVDISFSSVIRNLSGMDSIAQASGRGNRNAESDNGKTYIVNVEDENIGNLDYISNGQKHTKDLLSNYLEDSEKFDNSLLSPKSIKRYYETFYSDKDVNDKMDYPVNDAEGTILKLLTNDKAKKSRYNGNYPLSFVQQFAKAAGYFEVIDSKTKSVIVQWDDESENNISILLSDEDLSEKKKALKKLQSSTVNIYDNMFRQLSGENAFIPCINEDINILKSQFYDSEKGITVEGKSKAEIF